MTVVDVQVTGLVARTLVHLDDGAEEVLHASSALERCGHERHAEERAQRGQVDAVAALLKLVVHVQRADHRHIHVHQLRGEVEVALQIGGIDHVDDHVGHLLHQMSPDVELLGRVARQRVGAGQVGQPELIAEVRGCALGRVDGHAAVVAYMGMGAAGVVEQRCLATIGVAHQRHVDDAALAQCLVAQVVVFVLYRQLACGLGLGAVLLTEHLLPLLLRGYLDELGLLAAQRHLVAHQTVFHWVLQRCVQQHLHALSLHKAHLDDALAEAAVALHLYDDAALARFQFRQFHASLFCCLNFLTPF